MKGIFVSQKSREISSLSYGLSSVASGQYIAQKCEDKVTQDRF